MQYSIEKNLRYKQYLTSIMLTVDLIYPLSITYFNLASSQLWHP